MPTKPIVVSPSLMTKKLYGCTGLLFIAVNMLCFLASPATARTSTARQLAELTLEQLSEIEIVSVSRQAGTVLDAPASVFVITHEDIRRSGVTSLPEALRLAPGVEVARRDTHTWAISIRGFNNSISNKLLVLIDGRSVYSPLFAGVFWDAQDVLLEDVDRIEVISGPGGTLWGANAVNGVINVITRSAADTQGGFVKIGAGNEERGYVGLRYGGQLGEHAAARAYIKGFERDASQDLTGNSAGDDWRMAQGGFRVDWQPVDTEQFTFQGDIYGGEEGERFSSDFALGTLPDEDFWDKTEVSGGNLLGRWQQQRGSNTNLQLQIYFDHSHRRIPATVRETRNTFDVDFQYDFLWDDRNDIVWGAGLRVTEDDIRNSQSTAFEPDNRSDQTYSLFFQDKITLHERDLFLTLGTKVQHNDYTGLEWQPNIRLTWLRGKRQTLWTAASRAVRIPSRLDTDLRIVRVVNSDPEAPVYTTFNGNPELASETLWAYEIGYRIQASGNLSHELALFYNDYDKLHTLEPGPPVTVEGSPANYTIIPFIFGNEMEGRATGGTLVTKWQLMPSWRMQFHYAYTDLRLRNKSDNADSFSPALEGNTPTHQFAVHSHLDLPHNLSLYNGLRYVDELPDQDVPSYVALDLSLNWQPKSDLEIALTGSNLNGSHVEFGSDDMNQIERSIHGKIKWRF